MKTTKYSLIVLLLAGATLSTYAQDETSAPSEADREARRAEMIAQFDTDGDGVLSQEERQAARTAQQADGEARGPRGKGRGEMSAERKAEILAQFDADGDGVLSEAERATAREAGQADGEARGPRGQGRGEMSAEKKAEILAKYDVDGDGVLSEEERAAAREARQVSTSEE
jgi:Ca2+-binding EF-hand superfamily protein